MADNRESIGFEHKGIGSVLSHHRLCVPINQREYSWEEEHVKTLFEDLNNIIAGSSNSYFLGTIVLTKGANDVPEVTDGQQRLATTTMLLAAIRDYLLSVNETKRAGAIESKFLRTTDIDTEATVPKLQLNVDDNEFFVRNIVDPPSERKKVPKPTRESHNRIKAAFGVANEYVLSIVTPHNKSSRVTRLIEWIKFLEDGAQVIVLRVPDQLNAFVMFETLNDRGLRASQADLLKNYLLSKVAPARLKEAQQHWARMIGVLDSIGMRDLVVDYLRHSVICQKGPTIERALFSTIRDTVNSAPKAMEFLKDLSDGAQKYAALFNGEHVVWNEYDESTRGHVRTILELGVEQIRPLMFAVLQHFDVAETKLAFRSFVAWCVRFLVAGGRGGLLDRNYGLRAQEVAAGTIKTAKDLQKAMQSILPSDAAFEAAFAEARVSQATLARYYLRALERQVQNDQEPELIPNSEEVINLEHVLPQSPGAGWAHIDVEVAEAYYKRLGNMVLLKAKRNVAIGNKAFSDKKAELAASRFTLTSEVGKASKWDVQAITKRQQRLAKLAVQTWPFSY